MKRIVRRSDLADSLLCGGGLAEKYFLMSVRQSDIKVGKNLWHVNEYIWNPERGFLRGWHLLKRTWQFNSTLGFSILDIHSNYCFSFFSYWFSRWKFRDLWKLIPWKGLSAPLVWWIASVRWIVVASSAAVAWLIGSAPWCQSDQDTFLLYFFTKDCY